MLIDIRGKDESIAESIRKLRFLVLDEADRMIETGHFAELQNILKLTQRAPETPRSVRPTSHTSAAAHVPINYVLLSSDALEDPALLGFLPSEFEEKRPANETLQTLIFSATLSKDLQKNLKKKGDRKKKHQQKRKATSTLGLFRQADFQ